MGKHVYIDQPTFTFDDNVGGLVVADTVYSDRVFTVRLEPGNLAVVEAILELIRNPK